jgi:hypothetical protein
VNSEQPSPAATKKAKQMRRAARRQVKKDDSSMDIDSTIIGLDEPEKV